MRVVILARETSAAIRQSLRIHHRIIEKESRRHDGKAVQADEKEKIIIALWEALFSGFFELRGKDEGEAQDEFLTACGEAAKTAKR
jgi:hypothetical protein